MSITKIHGFKRGSETLSTQGTQLSVSEVALIEAETPATSLAEVVNALPSVASGPGSLVNNPMRLTFTLNHTRHPYSNLFYLTSVSMKKAGEDRFWECQMSYQTPAPSEATRAAQKKNKKKQKVKKPDSKKIKDQEPIEDPMDRPPDWSGSVKSMTRNRFVDLDGDLISHTNGQLISKPIAFHEDTIHWQWSWNILLSDLNTFMIDTEQLTGAINSGAVNLKIGKNTIKTVGTGEMKCLGSSYEEEYETVSISGGTGKKDEPTSKEFHYMRVTVSFEYTPGINWDQPPTSNHTKQWQEGVSPEVGELIPIPINNLGVTSGGSNGVAKEPWPLKPDGSAIHFTDLSITPPEDYGKLIKKRDFTGVTGNIPTPLRMYKIFPFQPFFSSYGLTLPIIDD